MQRRDFLMAGSAALLQAWMSSSHAADNRDGRYQGLLILVELKGGNDALNMVVPYADPLYAGLRPRLALKREDVLQLDEQTGLHPAMQNLLPLWRDKQLAVVQGLGYANPNLSHFRSIEIWDTASDANRYLQEGWLSRTFEQFPLNQHFAADGVLIGSPDLGPLTGSARAIALAASGKAAEKFVDQARTAQTSRAKLSPALQHVLKVEADIAQAADGFRAAIAEQAGQGAVALSPQVTQQLPNGAWGEAIKTALQVVANGKRANNAQVACLRLTLNGFDTHQNQLGTQANLLRDLADGLAALRTGLQELGVWEQTYVSTYAEFGRRPRENQSGGTDHGTAAAHLVMGGKVQGGLYGPRPNLAQLDGNGNLAFAPDFRQLYATLLDAAWKIPSADILGARFNRLPIIA